MDIAAILERPIPSQVVARERKLRFREYPLSLTTPATDEQLVSIDQYGIAGQSYYSRPNNATKKAVAGVAPTIYVRRSVAKRLADINAVLRSEAVTHAFGKPVELYVNEGLRSHEVQQLLYQEAFPRIIAEQNPDMSKLDVLKRRDQLIAKPSHDALSPAPHVTGGAVDVRLRYACPDLGYIPDSFVDMGYGPANTGKTADLDFFETKEKLTMKDRKAQRNRRAFYWLMRGALQGSDSGLVANPHEWWHWSYGDQMWAALSEAPHAFYGNALKQNL
jgi:D-alanyl-D-alanine dipeptidase